MSDPHDSCAMHMSRGGAASCLSRKLSISTSFDHPRVGPMHLPKSSACPDNDTSRQCNRIVTPLKLVVVMSAARPSSCSPNSNAVCNS